jgi:uncharacterized membrane protein YobD (UPF0266 family)
MRAKIILVTLIAIMFDEEMSNKGNCILFAVLAVSCFVAGFFNWGHFILSGYCSLLSFVSYFEYRKFKKSKGDFNDDFNNDFKKY